MSFTGGSFFTPATAARFSTGHTRGRIGGGSNGVNYPSPFFDVAHTYLPTTVKQMFKFCRYYFMTNPLINAIVVKLSEYPVTDLVVDHEDPEVVKKWTDYLHDTLRIRPFQIECGLDYHCYGNCPVSLSFPFQKYLTCRNCGFSEQAKKLRKNWIYTSNEFRLSCPKCGHTGAAVPKDWYYPDASGIKPIRWNVEDIEVNYNDIKGTSTYFYNIPAPLRADITLGKKDVVEDMPQIFLQAIKQQKGVVFSPANFFHLKRATLAWQDRGWGIPLVLPVLKDAFYLQIMKKAQEAILLEHVVPLRILFPQAASGTSDPFVSVNLLDWRDQVASEIARWRHDCVAPGSLVETDDGVVTAGDVSEGMLLRNHLGAYSTVEKVWRRSLRSGEASYRISARGLHGVAPVVSEGHPFLAARSVNHEGEHKLGDATFVRAKDLRVGDYVGYPTVLEEVPFDFIDLAQFTDRACTDEWCYVDHTSSGTPEAFELLASGVEYERASICLERGWSINQFKAAQTAIREGRTLRRLPRRIPVTRDLLWTLGLYLAEGGVTGKQVFFAANKKEELAYQRTYDAMQAAFGTSGFEVGKTGEACQHVFPSVVAAQVFSALCGGVATTKRIHPRLMHLPLPSRVHLVEGMFFGDGCDHVDGRSHKRTYTSVGASLACGAQRLLLSLGVAAGVSYAPPAPYDIRGKRGTSAGTYHVGVYGEQNEKLSQWFNGYAVDSDPVSRMGVFRDGYFWFRVTEIEEEHTSEVIGFQMSQEEARVHLEDDTEAHGTFCLAGMACANTNYIPIMPLPLGNQSIGGDGKALLLSGEMQMLGEQIIMGMGVPREFLQGGLSYAGTNVSMRMLENAFISYIGRQLQMINWMVKMIANFMQWPEVNVRFKPFKMADDLQRKSYLFQLNQSQKVSDQTLLSDADLDMEEENEIMMRENAKRVAATKKQQLAMAEIQGESQILMQKMQAKAQRAMQEQSMAQQAPGVPGGPEGQMAPMAAVQQAQAAGQGGGAPPQGGGGPMPGGGSPTAGGPMSGSVPAAAHSALSMAQDLGAPPGQEQMGVDLQSLAQGYAQQLMMLPEAQRDSALLAIESQSPELAQMVQQYIFILSRQEQSDKKDSGVDDRPLPEKLPARRDTQLV